MSKRVNVEDERVPILKQLMEYVGAVGTMLLDEIAYVNGRTKSGMGRAMNGIEREVDQVDEVVIDTGGKGVYNQWIYFDLIVIF